MENAFVFIKMTMKSAGRFRASVPKREIQHQNPGHHAHGNVDPQISSQLPIPASFLAAGNSFHNGKVTFYESFKSCHSIRHNRPARRDFGADRANRAEAALPDWRVRGLNANCTMHGAEREFFEN
jgi:hypothetical protein